jgi:hypothetical protein
VRALVAILIMALMATRRLSRARPRIIIPNARRPIISRRLRPIRVASHAIPTTSRSIERSGEFAVDVRRMAHGSDREKRYLIKPFRITP